MHRSFIVGSSLPGLMEPAKSEGFAMPTDGPPPMLDPPSRFAPAQRGGMRRGVVILLGISLPLAGLGTVMLIQRGMGWPGSAVVRGNISTVSTSDRFISDGRVPGAVPPDLSLPGSIEPSADEMVFSSIDGFVANRYVDLGEHVSAGQLLAEIKSPTLDREVVAAKQAVADAAQDVADRRRERESAEVLLEKTPVVDSGDGASVRELADRAAQTQTARAALSSAQQNFTVAKEKLERLGGQFGKLKIVAPFDGTIVGRNVDVGTVVTAPRPVDESSIADSSDPASAVPDSVGLFEVARLETLRIVVKAPMQFAPRIASASAVEVVPDDPSEPSTPGRVVRIAKAADPVTETLAVEVEVANPLHRLSRGTLASVLFWFDPPRRK